MEAAPEGLEAVPKKRFRCVYLHIGLGKTGTTAIQHHLLCHATALEESGYLFPRVFCPEPAHFRGNHSTYLEAMFASGSAERKRVSQVSMARAVLERTGAPALFQAFNDEFEASRAANLLLSAEGVGHFSRAQLLALFRWLGSYARDIRVIACLRHPESALSSEIQQRLKVGRTLNELYRRPPFYNFQVLLGTIAGQVGRQGMTLYDFADAKRHPGGVEGAFVEKLALDLPPPREEGRPRNTTMSLQAALALDLLNRRYPPLPDGRRDPRWHESDLRYCVGLPGQRYQAPERVICELNRLAAPQLEWLRATFGLRLDASGTDGGRSRARGWWYSRGLYLRACRLLFMRAWKRRKAGAAG